MKTNHIYYVLCTVLLLVGLIIFSQLPEGTYKQTEQPTNSGLSKSISEGNKYTQYFKIDGKVKSINIKFATWGKVISGEYVIEIGEGENILYKAVAYGKDIRDNGYYEVKMPENLKEGEQYFFSVYSADLYDEDLNLWLTESNANSGDLLLNGEKQAQKINYTLSKKIYDNRIVVFIIWFIFIVIALFIPYMRKKWILILYIFGFIVLLCRMIYNYKYEWLGLYDDMAHISYLTYVEQNDNFVPDFEDIKLLVSGGVEVVGKNQMQPLTLNSGIFIGKVSDTVCYLCHPPLYYKILSLFNAVEISESGLVSVNLNLLRLVNASIFLMAVLLIFYIGYTRIEDKAGYHLLYVTIISSLPMFSILGLTINNDNLLFLTVALTFLGATRFVENKRNLLTYMLIALGVCGTVMVKLTAGLILVVAAVVVVIKDFIQEKSCSSIINKNMICTIPIYILTLSYYVVLYIKYGKIQLGLPDLIPYEDLKTIPVFYYPVEQRIEYSFTEYIQYFFKIFFNQWVNGAQTKINVGQLPQYNFIKLIYIIFFIVIVYQIKNIVGKNKFQNVLGAFSLGIVITIIAEIYVSYNSYLELGRGAAQSRYYVCTLFIMALIFIDFIKRINKKLCDYDSYIDIVCTSLSALFLYCGWIIYFSFG